MRVPGALRKQCRGEGRDDLSGGIGVADVPDPPREHKDHALRWLFQHLRNPSPRVFGVPCPNEVEVLSPVIPLLETKAVVVDGLLRGVPDGSVWSLEFEMGTPDYRRLIEHHVAVARAHPGAQVESVVFWGRQHAPARQLQFSRVTLHAYQVFLPDMDGAAELERLQAAATAGAVLTDGDILLLATLPLMRHRGGRIWDVLRASAPVAAALPEDLERGVVTAMGALAYSALDPRERPFLLEVLGRMPAGQELFEDLREQGREQGRKQGREQGRHEGEVRKAREDILDAFEARFGYVPAGLRETVAASEDLHRLGDWLRAVVRAADAEAAQRAILAAR